MALVSASITKIRRLVRDAGSDIFSDAWVLEVFGRIQQEFCMKAMCEKAIYLIKAPPNIDYAFVHIFEEGYVTGFSFSPFMKTSALGGTQPWELETSYTGDTTGGSTSTGGTELPYQEVQHRVPFPLPDSVYNLEGLMWDYKTIEYRSIEWVREHRLDAWENVSDIVDFFSMEKAWRKKAFVTHSTPKTVQSSGTNEASQIGETLLTNVFYAFSNEVPDRPSAVGSTIAVHDPFQKYVEFGVAAQLLKADTAKASPARSAHFRARYELGIQFVRRCMKRGYSQKRFISREQGGWNGGLRPPRPRLPDHYPRLEA